MCSNHPPVVRNGSRPSGQLDLNRLVILWPQIMKPTSINMWPVEVSNCRHIRTLGSKFVSTQGQLTNLPTSIFLKLQKGKLSCSYTFSPKFMFLPSLTLIYFLFLKLWLSCNLDHFHSLSVISYFNISWHRSWLTDLLSVLNIQQ